MVTSLWNVYVESWADFAFASYSNPIAHWKEWNMGNKLQWLLLLLYFMSPCSSTGLFCIRECDAGISRWLTVCCRHMRQSNYGFTFVKLLSPNTSFARIMSHRKKSTNPGGKRAKLWTCFCVNQSMFSEGWLPLLMAQSSIVFFFPPRQSLPSCQECFFNPRRAISQLTLHWLHVCLTLLRREKSSAQHWKAH